MSYIQDAEDIKDSIELGLQAEIDDPNVYETIKTITPSQIHWIAAWLAGEGFHKRKAYR